MGRYEWARGGDVNAFFGLMLDNVAVMVLLFSTIASTTPLSEQATQGRYAFTPEFVLTHMIPGTALGVLAGDLIYTWMAFRLARRSGNRGVTAMPLGLDTPSTFGIAFFILLPALQHGHQLYADHEEAMRYAWRIGVVMLFVIGVLKVVLAPLGNAVRRWVPPAGLLGSLAAIALALIAFLPLVMHGIAAAPLVGIVALMVVLITLVAHRALPGRFPGALAAVVVGVLLYWGGFYAGNALGWPLVPPPLSEGVNVVWQPPSLLAVLGDQDGSWQQVLRDAWDYLPVAVPFGLLTIVGGIDCTESAAAAGDEFDTRTILLTEGGASLLAACLGGVIQTTPYIGHPAYKAMGGRAAYTLATALFIGAAGYFGWFLHLFHWLPPAAMYPILVFVGVDITAHSFRVMPQRHYPALALAVLPALAALGMVLVDSALASQRLTTPVLTPQLLTLRCLANGFVVTSLLWAAALAALLDGRLRRAAVYLAVAGLFALFGVIHSPFPDSPLMLPHTAFARLPDDAAFRSQSPYHWAAAYGLCAALLLALSFSKKHETAR